MLAAFEALAERRAGHRLLAVLAHMGELGDVAESAHHRVGSRASEVFDEVAVIDTPLGRLLAGSARAELLADNKAAAEWVRRPAPPRRNLPIQGSDSPHLGAGHAG